jgi:surface carbohydrate biosynthesis protein
MKFSSVSIVLAYFWHSKKIWRKPGKATVLIVDRPDSEVFLTYLDRKSVDILDLRGESLNLYVLFKCLLHWKLSPIDYSFQYLACVKPRVALTFTDNNPLFYQLKTHQKNLTTLFVQNGVRGEHADVFGFFKMQTHSSNKRQVDHMLTFGNVIGREYSKYIEGATHSIGSFKNNLYQSKTQVSLKSVLFLSQYRPPQSRESKPIYMQDNKPIFRKQFYSTEEFLLPLLHQYCLQNKLELKICMCSDDQTNEESNYFRSLLENRNFELTKTRNIYSSYEEVAAAGFVVFVESTLGYEALARGKKTAAFSLRGKLLGAADRNFGWPADLPENGPFWTNYADEREFKRVMDYITTVSDEEWEQTRHRYVPELMEYDPGNTRFLKLMCEIGVPLKAEYQNDV